MLVPLSERRTYCDQGDLSCSRRSTALRASARDALRPSIAAKWIISLRLSRSTVGRTTSPALAGHGLETFAEELVSEAYGNSYATSPRAVAWEEPCAAARVSDVEAGCMAAGGTCLPWSPSTDRRAIGDHAEDDRAQRSRRT